MSNKQEFAERMKSIIASSKGKMGRLEEVTIAITEAAVELGCIKDLRRLSWDGKTYGEAIAYFEDDDILNEYILGDDDESFTEMATVVTSEKPKIKIAVNPDGKRKGNPYFKVYDDFSPKQHETQVIRPHFKDEEMEYHNDAYYDWDPKNNEWEEIRDLLQKQHEDFTHLTNWQMACFLWNAEYGFFGADKEYRKKYFNHEFDEEFRDNPSYVPSTQEMPEKWIYRPGKSKSKR